MEHAARERGEGYRGCHYLNKDEAELRLLPDTGDNFRFPQRANPSTLPGITAPTTMLTDGTNVRNWN